MANYSKTAYSLEPILVSENSVFTTHVVRNKKYPFHAYCKHKETGHVVEQASRHKTHAIRLAETEMNARIKNNEIGSTDSITDHNES
jgi:hypothetical protein